MLRSPCSPFNRSAVRIVLLRFTDQSQNMAAGLLQFREILLIKTIWISYLQLLKRKIQIPDLGLFFSYLLDQVIHRFTPLS